jgi:hypothetical protein
MESRASGDEGEWRTVGEWRVGRTEEIERCKARHVIFHWRYWYAAIIQRRRCDAASIEHPSGNTDSDVAMIRQGSGWFGLQRDDQRRRTSPRSERLDR